MTDYPARRPRKSANWSGTPKSLMLTGPWAATRALRVRRCVHESRSVSSLRPRQDHWRKRGAALARGTLRLPHLEVLITHQQHTGSSMLSPAPVLPEERRTRDGERMQEATS